MFVYNNWNLAGNYIYMYKCANQMCIYVYALCQYSWNIGSSSIQKMVFITGIHACGFLITKIFVILAGCTRYCAQCSAAVTMIVSYRVSTRTSSIWASGIADSKRWDTNKASLLCAQFIHHQLPACCQWHFMWLWDNAVIRRTPVCTQRMMMMTVSPCSTLQNYKNWHCFLMYPLVL